MKNLNVFRGRNSAMDFLNPDKNFPVPLVEIPEAINPFHDDGVRIHAKLLNMLPLSNVKSLPAFNMLEEADKKGNAEKLIESSSGNTVLSLAVLGRLKGTDTTKAIVSNEVSKGKLQLLRLFGVDVSVIEEPICPDPEDMESGIYKAKIQGTKKGWFNAGQYENEANPKAHEKWTAKQIWEQTEGDVQVFCAGLGTTGTMTGCSRFFKNKNKSIKTVGVARTPNNLIPGVRTKGLLKMIAFEWEKYTDYVEEAGTVESFEKSLELIRHGLVAGPSSGFALAGLLKFLKSMKEKNELDGLKNEKGEINAVFICCDSPFPYLEDYFSYLDNSLFPEVENENLLLNQTEGKKQFSRGHEIQPEEAYELLYDTDREKLWDLIREGSEIKTKEDAMIIDVRSRQEFEHFRLAGSENVELKDIVSGAKEHADKMKGKKIIVVCNHGISSASATEVLRKEGADAMSLKGGITEWSDRNFPRWKPDVCFK